MAAALQIWQPIGEMVAEFRGECSDFEHHVEGLFEQLDRMRAELDRKMREVERERQKVAERERQLADQRHETGRITHQFEHQEAQLCEALAELEELKNIVRRAAEDTQQHDALVESQIEKQLETMHGERQSLQHQLAEAQTEIAKHASLAKELAAARKEVAELHAQVASAGGNNSALLELQQERAALEAELEMVRSRAADLFESLNQERKATNEQRSETSTELKQLRRIVERQAELLNDRPTATSAPSAQSVAPREVAVADLPDQPLESNTSDAVVSSVMAQFAKLQKEVAERRKHRPPNSKPK